MKDARRVVEALRERLKNGERDVSESEAELLLEFSDRLDLLNSKYSDYRHRDLLRKATIMAEETGRLEEALEDREAAEDIVRWINTAYDNEETNRDYRSALRVFGKRTVGEGEVPDSLEWVPTSTSRNYDPAPEPGNMYRWEEHVLPMIDAANQDRDKAVLALQFDAGLRSGELHDPRNDSFLQVGDITDGKYGLKVSVDGKQGKRSATLIPSVPYVQEWLENHPGDGDGDAPFVSKINRSEPVSYRQFLKIFRQAARKVDITLPADSSPTRFRKSSVSYMASKGVSQAHLEDRYGWSHGSDKAARYVTVFGEASEREVAKAHGVEVEDDDDEAPKNITCPRCHRETPEARDFCIHCSQALDPEKQEVVETLIEEIDTTLVAEESAETREALLRGRRSLEESPNLMDSDELHDLASRLSSED